MLQYSDRVIAFENHTGKQIQVKASTFSKILGLPWRLRQNRHNGETDIVDARVLIYNPASPLESQPEALARDRRSLTRKLYGFT